MSENSGDMITLSRADLDAWLESKLAEREQQHAEQLAAVRAQMPQTMVPAHSGGPGSNRHQRSWSLAEQEAALRGEILDHWA